MIGLFDNIIEPEIAIVDFGVTGDGSTTPILKLVEQQHWMWNHALDSILFVVYGDVFYEWYVN